MTTATETPEIITIDRLVELGAGRTCDQLRQVRRLYPTGVPLTYASALRLHEAGVDVLFIASKLLDQAGRTEFILFTLRQRQPHVVALLRAANLHDHADAVAALSFATTEDAAAAQPVLDAAWDAAGAAVMAAAGAAARAAARDAAGAAVMAAAGAAAGDAAWAAAGDAAWAAVWAAAGDAAWAAAGDAAWAAATKAQLGWIARYLNLPDAPPDADVTPAAEEGGAMNTTATETLSLRERAKLAYQEAEAARAAERAASIASACQELRNDLALKLHLYFGIALNDIVIVNDEWGEPREAVARDSGLYFSVTSALCLFVEAECAACHQKGDCWTFHRATPAENWESLGKSIAEFDAAGGVCSDCRDKAARK